MDTKKAVAFDDVESTDEVDEMPEVESPETSETVTLSLDMLGGKASKGDIVRLEIVDVSEEDGTATVKYHRPKSGGGIEKAAAAFNEGV